MLCILFALVWFVWTYEFLGMTLGSSIQSTADAFWWVLALVGICLILSYLNSAASLFRLLGGSAHTIAVHALTLVSINGTITLATFGLQMVAATMIATSFSIADTKWADGDTERAATSLLIIILANIVLYTFGRLARK